MAIGRFVVAFGHIEWYTYELLVHLPTENIFPAVAHLGFKDRATLAIELLADSRFAGAPAKSLQRALRKAITLASTRNIVAHNPVMLSLYTNTDGEIDFRPEISPFRDPKKRLTLAEVRKLGRQAEDLAGEVYEHQNRVFHDST